MANYRKSLNLRYGVQVDDDNFIVNSNGAVGIGTSIPTALLDVRGNVRVIGFTNSDNLYAGVSTAERLYVNQDAKITGVITATTFFGSAAGLTDIYAIAVDGWYVSGGTISTTSKVGLGNLNPNYQLQIGGDPSSSNGIGADSLGNIIISGVTTIGNSLGVSGITTTTNLRVSGLATITSLNVTGVATVPTLTITTSATVPILTVNTGLNGKNVTLTGNLKSTSLNITGITTTNNLIVTGVATASSLDITGAVNFSSGMTVIGSTNTTTLSASAGITAQTLVTSLNITTPELYVTNFTSTQNLITTGVGTISTLNVSNNITGSSNLYLPAGNSVVGVGTDSVISNVSLQINRPNTSSMLIYSDNSESLISLGRNKSLTDLNGVIKFGNTTGSFPYSDSKSFDFINYNTGNFNFYLEAGTTGVGTGSFYWHRRKSLSRLMTLTYEGNLGIGITVPTSKLHVVGSASASSLSISGISNLTGTVTCNNDLTVSGTANIDTLIVNKPIDANLDVSTGITTVNALDVNTTADIVDLKVNAAQHSQPSHKFSVNNLSSDKFFIDAIGAVGVSTDRADVSGINALTVSSIFGAVGVGTTDPRCAIDFSSSTLASQPTAAFMTLPVVTTTQRNALIKISGGLVFNSTLKRLELYNGIGWVGLTTNV